MADPRFYDNAGPFSLAEICKIASVSVPEGVSDLEISDVASLSGAGANHISFFSGSPSAGEALEMSRAGYCLIPDKPLRRAEPPKGMVALRCKSVMHSFSKVAARFYPDSTLGPWAQQTAVDPTAHIGEQVTLGPGVVVGPGAEIGDRTRIGANAVIGRGVAIGSDCEIASNVTITHAYLGDNVVILPGAQIGQPGFGFASDGSGHLKVPQLGRVIVQDRVELGACTTVDRGALGDTVIGEGTKIDNLVQIGHNTRLGRHCMIVSQVGISGSCELGDYVVLGGQVGIADHVKIGSGARVAARSAMAPGVELGGGRDYGGVPAKPAREWIRELHAVAQLAKKDRQ
ncbi:MAG: UDP-3-O-(3-hydroxymyristoyl)glucosamine N-acyltransferase [Alphaproteobacteria bacterium]|nr:UDP-3-O-(3-hydroxymyristoyl)glucosamine N-acyltransferase [Alphaproteobacteria bacterium]